MRAASLAAFALVTAASATATFAQAVMQDSYGFDIDIVLSPKAATTLAARGEQLLLFASYFGDPKKGAEKYANEVGHIDLTSHDAPMTVAGRSGAVHFKGPAIAARRLAMLDGPVMVNLNIATARKSSENNLLACDFIEGKLAEVRKTPITLHCGLIDERIETAVKP